MIDPREFVDLLNSQGISFFVGVPDSAMKGLCNYLDTKLSKKDHIIAANEGNAIAIATGYHLATRKIPFVYMQNSGLGNAINPLTSLANKEIYSIPMIIMVGWRGFPGKEDEPQHTLMGNISQKLIDVIGYPNFTLLKEDLPKLEKLVFDWSETAKQHSSPVLILCEKGLFDDFKSYNDNEINLTRDEFLEQLVKEIDEDYVCIATTGKTGRELYELRVNSGTHPGRDLLIVGSMGHTSSVGLGLALNSSKKIIVLDGDGSSIMHLGSGVIIGDLSPTNLYHIIFNNGTHQSVGSQKLFNSKLDFLSVYTSMGYQSSFQISKKDELNEKIKEFLASTGPSILEVKINNFSRKDLGRPQISNLNRKEHFMEYINAAKST